MHLLSKCHVFYMFQTGIGDSKSPRSKGNYGIHAAQSMAVVFALVMRLCHETGVAQDSNCECTQVYLHT